MRASLVCNKNAQARHPRMELKAVCEILPRCVFNAADPIIVGVAVLPHASLAVGATLYAIKADGSRVLVGRATDVRPQDGGKAVIKIVADEGAPRCHVGADIHARSLLYIERVK